MAGPAAARRGGNLGAWLLLLLRETLTPVAQILALAGAVFLGLLLGLDFALVPLLRLAGRMLGSFLGTLRRLVRRRLGSRPEPVPAAPARAVAKSAKAPAAPPRAGHEWARHPDSPPRPGGHPV